jgi:hypothetical protein
LLAGDIALENSCELAPQPMQQSGMAPTFGWPHEGHGSLLVGVLRKGGRYPEPDCVA